MDDMYNDENQNENQNGTPDENQNENERENNGVNAWGSSEGGNGQQSGQQPGMEEQSQQSGRSTVQEQLQQQYRQPTVQEQLQYQYQQPQDELEEPMTMGEWMITLLIMLIPCANIIMAFVWAFSSTEKKSKSDGKKGEQCGTGSPVLIKKKPCRQRTQQDKAQPHGKAGGGIAEAGGPAQGQKEEQEPRAAAERGRIRGKELGLRGMGVGHSVHLVVGKKEKSPDHSELRHKKT